jgi:predicted RNase H-like nuclease (RuvC/YqgF family)
MEFVFAITGFMLGAILCALLVFSFHPIEKENYGLREEMVKLNNETGRLNNKIEKLQTENQSLKKVLELKTKYSDGNNPETLHWFELNRTVDELSRQKIILSKDKMMLESDIAALEKLLQERKEEYFNDNSKN